MLFDFKHRILELNGKIARLTLNKPALLNAMYHEAGFLPNQPFGRQATDDLG